jgi:hypothetical protein
MINILLGSLFILLGTFILYDFIKNPVEKNYFAANSKGIVGSALLILIGVLLLIGKIHF